MTLIIRILCVCARVCVCKAYYGKTVHYLPRASYLMLLSDLFSLLARLTTSSYQIYHVLDEVTVALRYRCTVCKKEQIYRPTYTKILFCFLLLFFSPVKLPPPPPLV